MKLEIRNLSKRYGTKQALDNVSCKLSDGVYGLLGANGAGKSTLMNIITGNIKADVGEVFLDGKNILKPENQHEFREYFRVYAAVSDTISRFYRFGFFILHGGSAGYFPKESKRADR